MLNNSAVTKPFEWFSDNWWTNPFRKEIVEVNSPTPNKNNRKVIVKLEVELIVNEDDYMYGGETPMQNFNKIVESEIKRFSYELPATLVQHKISATRIFPN